MNPIVPAPDVLPLPAPVWLLEFLLVFTFILHLVPMNFLFGGGLLAAFSHLRAKNDPRHERLARRLAELMPTVIAFTVTLGVAPLLFVQALYGQFAYSSSILMANAWFAVVPLLIVAYYLAYLIRFKWTDLGGLRTGLAWIVAGIVAAIGFIYSNNFSLMLRPDTWAAHYFADPASGSLNWSDPALYPRYLHMLVGAVAVAGVWFLILGVRRRSGDVAWSKWAVQYGARIFIYATLVNIIIGFWFLVALPKEVMMIFMGQNLTATILLIASLVLTAGAWMLLRKAARAEDPRKPAVVGVAHVLGILVLMAIMRQQVRTAYLEPCFRLDSVAVKPQWDVFALFAVTLVIGLAVLAWLIKIALGARPGEG
jgi:hypothetical protein